MNKDKYTLEQLTQLILLLKHFTGKMPKELGVTGEVIDWYNKTIDKVRKDFKLKGKSNEYRGVKLIKKLKAK